MTRWKLAPRATLVLLHAHNSLSDFRASVLQAAADLGLPVAETSYPNCSGDGSWDLEFYTSEAALERIGGLARLKELAAASLDAGGAP